MFIPSCGMRASDAAYWLVLSTPKSAGIRGKNIAKENLIELVSLTFHLKTYIPL